MIIDGHSHVILPTERHIKMMDEAGIDKTVLFSTSVHPERAGNAHELKTEMRKLNEIISGKRDAANARIASMEELRNTIRKYPDRFLGFASVPVALSYADTMQYIENQFVDFNYVGFGEFTLSNGQIKLLEHIFRASSDMKKLPIWIHAFNPLVLPDIKEIGELAKSNPGIPVILGHLGGSNWLESLELAKEIPNLYLDISAFFSTLVLKIVINELPHKCIFGADLPYGDLLIGKEAVERLAKDSCVIDAVLGDNIAQLLKL